MGKQVSIGNIEKCKVAGFGDTCLPSSTASDSSLIPYTIIFCLFLIVLEENLNAESLFWLDIVNLNRKVYNTPFVLLDVLVYNDGASSTTTEHLLQFMRKSVRESRHVCFSFTDLCSKSEVQKIAEDILASKQDVLEVGPNQRYFL
jgi:hypothetical protein